MAYRATDRFGRDIVIGMFGGQIRMTTGAGIGLVDRGRQFRAIHEQRNLFAGGIGFGQGLVGMTIHAGAIADRG